MKKFFKKIGAFLTAGTILTVMTGNLYSCSEKEAISVGSFLNKTVAAFGMANYTKTDPYFDNIDSSNVYYEVVQMAGDRNAFAEYSKLNLDDPLTQEMAALVLVNVADMPTYCTADSDIDIRNKKKLLNEDKIKLAVSNDMFELSPFDSSFKKDKELSEDEADAVIDKAVDIWSGREYEDKLEYKITEGVKDLSQGDKAISSDDFYYTPASDVQSSENNTDSVDDVVLSTELSKKILESEMTNGSEASELESITLPDGTTLSEGDTYLLPATEDSSMQAFVVDEITTDGENIVLSNSPVDDASTDLDNENILVDDVFENLEQMGTISDEEMDLTKYHITDGLGNELEWVSYDNNQSATNTTGVNYSQNGGIVQLGNYNTDSITATPLIDIYGKKDAELGYLNLSFKVDDIQIKGKIEKNSISVSAISSTKTSDISGGKIEGEKWAKEKFSGKTSIGWEKTLSISDMSVNYGIRTSWGKLEWAQLIANYKTTDTTKLSTKLSIGSNFAPPYTNGNGKFLTNLNRSIWKAPNSKGAKSIKICSIPFVTAGPASLNLVIRINFSLSGEISLTCETECSKGFEYENGNFNFVNNEKKENKAELKGKAELTLAVGMAIMAFGKNFCEVDCEFGVGCSIALTQYLIDENNALREKIDNVEDTPPQAADELSNMTFESDDGKHTLKTDYCFDISSYFIVKASIPGDCTVGKIIGPQSHSFVNEKNAKIEAFSGHWENGSYVGKGCTKDYKEPVEEETTTLAEETKTVQTYAPEEKEYPTFAEENYGDEKLEMPLSATMYLNMEIGDSSKIEITSLPDGYTASDIIFVSENEDVVSVDSNGSVYAKSEGATVIQIKTSDKQFETACTVIVKTNQ